MAASLVLDEVAGAMFQTGTSSLPGRRIRTGRIKDIDVDGTNSIPDPSVLEKCLNVSGMPQIGELIPQTGITAIDVYIANYVLLQHVFVAKKYNQVGVQLIYGPPNNNFSGVAGSFAIRDTNRLVRTETNMLHSRSGNIPIRVGWQDPDDPDNFVPDDYIKMTYDRPFRSIQLTGLIYGSPIPSALPGQLQFGPPPTAQRDAIGCVNDAFFYGFPRAYWRVDAYETDTRTNQSYYTVQAELNTRKTEDWSETGILRNQQTGRYVKVKQSDIDHLLAAPYVWGDIEMPDAGIIRIGFYEPINFAAIFPLLT